jgi:hypothetical protein
VSYQDETCTTECTLDQGGLVVIAAICCCGLSLVFFDYYHVDYLQAQETDMTFVNGQIANAFDQRRRERNHTNYGHNNGGNKLQSKRPSKTAMSARAEVQLDTDSRAEIERAVPFFVVVYYIK